MFFSLDCLFSFNKSFMGGGWKPYIEKEDKKTFFQQINTTSYIIKDNF